jgi:pyrroloquinoline-quinone synthase
MTNAQANIDEIDRVFERLDTLIDSVPVHKNRFYDAFVGRDCTRAELQFIADQYYYYIRTFPQILAGLSHRVDSEEVRLRLAKTVVSELGECQPGKMHFQLFEKVMGAVDIEMAPIDTVKHIPEAEALVDGLRDLFLKRSTIAAIGGHYTIERTGLGMIKHLYEGMRRYPSVSVEAMEYFYLHLFLEADHVNWIKDAVRQHAGDPNTIPDLESGALEVAKLLANFWEGLYQNVFARPLAHARTQLSA